MIINDLVLGLELVAALVTTLYVGRLLLEGILKNLSPDWDQKVFNVNKRSLLNQHIYDRRNAAVGG